MINQLYRAFFKLPVEAEFAFWTGDTGIHEWIVEENRRILAKANYCPHNL